MEKQSLIKGTIILSIAGILAKFLGLFFRYPLIMLIGDEGVGYYQMAYPLYAFFLGISAGIPIAVSKMVSEKRAMNDNGSILLILKKSILLMGILGGGFSAVLLIFSKQIIHILSWDEKSYYSLIGIAFAPFCIGIMSAFRGFFQGMQNMYPTAVSQIIEQIGRIVAGIGLAIILLPKGIEYSAGAAALGAAVGGALGGIYLISKYKSVKKQFCTGVPLKDDKILDRLLSLAIPISIGAAVGSIMGLLDSLLVPKKLLEAGYSYKDSTILYGQLTGKAGVLVHIPITLSVALCTSLMPIIAENFKLNRRKELIEKTNLAMKVAAVIALPSFLGLFFMSSQILNLLFPGHSEGALILKYSSISIPFIILSQVCISILQGVDRVVLPVVNIIIGCVVKILITEILVPIPGINVYGAIIANIVGYAVAAILNLILMKRTLKIKINYYDILIKPAYASVIMIIVVVFTYSYVYNYSRNNFVSTILVILLGMIIYFIQIGLLNLFNNKSIQNKLSKFKITKKTKER